MLTKTPPCTGIQSRHAKMGRVLIDTLALALYKIYHVIHRGIGYQPILFIVGRKAILVQS